MTDEQRQAVERLRKDNYGAYSVGDAIMQEQKDLRTVAEMYFAEHTCPMCEGVGAWASGEDGDEYDACHHCGGQGFIPTSAAIKALTSTDEVKSAVNKTPYRSA